LGYDEALALLKANEQEEKGADAKLSKLAESPSMQTRFTPEKTPRTERHRSLKRPANVR
jgi:ferritin-like metal-binding protein YciE